MSINPSKQLAEKIHMFYNLLYHIDDYIKNKKERKGQLRVSKNIRLVLREIISSKINLNYFINKEELDSYKIEKKSEDIIQKEKQYIKTINPLSFNQKNLDCINLFYNTNNEMFIINYFSIEKIFSIIQFCFRHIIKQKNIEFNTKFEKENKNFVLYNTDEDEFLDYNNKNSVNNIIKNQMKTTLPDSNYRNYLNNRRLIELESNRGNDSVNVFAIMNNSFKLNNITSMLNNNKNFNNKNNNLKIQISKLKKMQNKNNLLTIKENIENSLTKKTLKKNISLPLINVKKTYNNETNSGYSKENNKTNEYKYLISSKQKNEEKIKKSEFTKIYNYNRILPLYNKSKKINYYKKEKINSSNQ